MWKQTRRSFLKAVAALAAVPGALSSPAVFDLDVVWQPLSTTIDERRWISHALEVEGHITGLNAVWDKGLVYREFVPARVCRPGDRVAITFQDGIPDLVITPPRRRRASRRT